MSVRLELIKPQKILKAHFNPRIGKKPI